MKKLICIYILSLLSISISHANDLLDDFINDPLLKNSNISLLIKDIDSDTPLYEYRADHSQIPASTMKVVTTATAIELLGGDFRFETKLQIQDEITEDGTLNGNLYIVGGGDPTLGSNMLGSRDFFKFWVYGIKRAGIQKINGSIVVDESIFEPDGYNNRWLWEDIGNYYAPGIYGVSYLDNTIRVHFKSGPVGTCPEIIRMNPEVPGLILENHLLCTNIGKDSAYFHGAPKSYTRTICGEVPANKDVFIAKAELPNPGLLLAQHLHDALIDSNIPVSFPPYEERGNGAERKTIYTHYSPSLSRIIKEINFTSNNHYAEHVFKYLALQKNATGTNNGAVNVIREFWTEKGLPVEQLFMYDGSGLSPSNAVSARFMVELLTYMKKDSNNALFFESLPVGGKSGTIAWLWNKSPLEGKIHAKSGSINRVRCYSGYVDKGEKTYAFSIMINNYPTDNPRQIVRKIEKFLISVMQ